MSQLLTAQAVLTLCLTCAQQADEVAPIVQVEGITRRFGFVRERVQQHRAAIDELLAQLPHGFRTQEYGGGGGWSFLNACVREDGTQWADHGAVELLLALGLAAGSAAYSLPRDMWDALPGGLPYFHILPPQVLSSHDAR